MFAVSGNPDGSPMWSNCHRTGKRLLIQTHDFFQQSERERSSWYIDALLCENQRLFGTTTSTLPTPRTYPDRKTLIASRILIIRMLARHFAILHIPKPVQPLRPPPLSPPSPTLTTRCHTPPQGCLHPSMPSPNLLFAAFHASTSATYTATHPSTTPHSQPSP